MLSAMEVSVLEQNKNHLALEIKGEGHSMCNLLKKELWNDENIVTAGYVIEHPQIGVPKFFIETKAGTTPKEALLDAVKRLKKQNEKFEELFLAEVK